GRRVDRRVAAHAAAPAAPHAQIRPRLFRDARGLEPPRFDGDGRALRAPPQSVGSPVRAALRQLEQPLDHAATSPPTSACSMRTCGAPSVTGRGYCPALPHPPPI